MQEKVLFEYAVVRVMPRVERQEFLNVGVVLYCSAQRFLKCSFRLDEERLKAFSADMDIATLTQQLHAFCTICEGGTESGPIGKLPLASRFRWLTATRSTIVQTSPVHPGLCADASETLQKLFKQLVL